MLLQCGEGVSYKSWTQLTINRGNPTALCRRRQVSSELQTKYLVPQFKHEDTLGNRKRSDARRNLLQVFGPEIHDVI